MQIPACVSRVSFLKWFQGDAIVSQSTLPFSLKLNPHFACDRFGHSEKQTRFTNHHCLLLQSFFFICACFFPRSPYNLSSAGRCLHAVINVGKVLVVGRWSFEPLITLTPLGPTLRYEPCSVPRRHHFQIIIPLTPPPSTTTSTNSLSYPWTRSDDTAYHPSMLAEQLLFQ